MRTVHIKIYFRSNDECFNAYVNDVELDSGVLSVTIVEEKVVNGRAVTEGTNIVFPIDTVKKFIVTEETYAA